MIRRSSYFKTALFSLLAALMVLSIRYFYSANSAASDSEVLTSTTFQGQAIHTLYSVKITGDLPENSAELEHEIKDVLERVNNEISTFKPDSILSSFNKYQGSEPRPISTGMADIITTALRIGNESHEAMNVTVGPLVNLWGFGPDKSKRGIIPSQAQIDQTKQKVGLKYLKLISESSGYSLQKEIPDLYVDLSCLGEGYATQQLSYLLDHKGITNYLISVGNATFARGVNAKNKPWKIAIRTPTDEDFDVQKDAINLQGFDVSTSGSYLNYFEKDGKRYSHIIDPVSGKPIEHNLASATVIASTPLEANGWDISMMVLGPEKAIALAKEKGLAIYLIMKTEKGYTTYMSPQFKQFLVRNSEGS